MKRVLFAAALAAVVPNLDPAHAASPFDGTWQGTIIDEHGNKGYTVCPTGQGRMTMLIQDGRVVKGRAIMPRGTPPVHGIVADDGTFNGTLGYTTLAGKTAKLTGKFTGDSFAGRYVDDAGVCTASVTLTRAH